MTADTGPEGATTLSPDDAFGLLGHETRLGILQTLGEADGLLAYSELFDRIDYDDSANFTYHLEQLVGHFVRKTDDGYALRRAGQRVVEAIYSGVMTDDPVVERTEAGMPCMYCGEPAEVGYHQEVLLIYCTECDNQIDRADAIEDWPVPTDDVVGYVSLPPAGIYDRTPPEALDAAGIWTIIGVQSMVRGVCPGCSAAIDRSAVVCEDHDEEDGFCERCGHQFGVKVAVSCTNCIFETRAPFPTHALAETDLMAFLIEHDVDPFSPGGFHLSACDEEIISTDPLEVRYTFSADGDALTLAVDGDLSVVDATRSRAPHAEERA
jgi:hypothetical protein